MSDLQHQAVAAALHQLFVVRDPEALQRRSLAHLSRDPVHKLDKSVKKLGRDPSVKQARTLNRLANPRRAFHI